MTNLKVQTFIYNNLAKRMIVNKALNCVGKVVRFVGLPYATGVIRSMAAIHVSNKPAEIEEAVKTLEASNRKCTLESLKPFQNSPGSRDGADWLIKRLEIEGDHFKEIIPIVRDANISNKTALPLFNILMSVKDVRNDIEFIKDILLPKVLEAEDIEIAATALSSLITLAMRAEIELDYIVNFIFPRVLEAVEIEKGALALSSLITSAGQIMMRGDNIQRSILPKVLETEDIEKAATALSFLITWAGQADLGTYYIVNSILSKVLEAEDIGKRAIALFSLVTSAEQAGISIYYIVNFLLSRVLEAEDIEAGCERLMSPGVLELISSLIISTKQAGIKYIGCSILSKLLDAQKIKAKRDMISILGELHSWHKLSGHQKSALVARYLADITTFEELKHLVKIRAFENELFAEFATMGGKINLSKENFSFVTDVAAVLGFVMAAEKNWTRDWVKGKETTSEIHFPSVKQYLFPLDAIKILLISGMKAGNEKLGAISVQISLKVDGLFWGEDKELKQEVKMLAMALLLTNGFNMSYTDFVARFIDTYGPIVEGGGRLKNEKGEIIRSQSWYDRADLYSVCFIGAKDNWNTEGAYEKVIRRYSMIGNALLGYFKEGKKTLLEEEMSIIIGDTFIKEMDKLLKGREIYDALFVSWKRGNWKELKGLLEKLQNEKENNIMVGKDEMSLKVAVEGLLMLTEREILAALIKNWAKNNADKLKEEELKDKTRVIYEKMIEFNYRTGEILEILPDFLKEYFKLSQDEIAEQMAHLQPEDSNIIGNEPLNKLSGDLNFEITGDDWDDDEVDPLKN